MTGGVEIPDHHSGVRQRDHVMVEFFPNELSQRRCRASIHHHEEPGLVTILIDSDVA